MLKFTTAIALVLVCASLALAGKGGGKGKPGDGGGGDPPADPAIAYIDRTGGGSALMVMNADGSNKTVLVESDAADPNWSPDGGQIVFQGGNSALTNALYVISVDGTVLTQLPKPEGGYAVQPAWSPAPAPDGKYKIAFKAFADIWLVNPDGTGLHQLTNSDDIAQNHPTWDPDAGRMAVFFVEHIPETGVRTAEGVMLLDLALGTSNPVDVVSKTRVVEQAPDPHFTGFDHVDWARTQDKILYRVQDPYLSVNDGNSADIWIVDVGDPDNPVTGIVTDEDGATAIQPRWSPDDSQILFTRLTGRKKDSGLYLMNPDGTGLTSLGVKSGAGPDWRR